MLSENSLPNASDQPVFNSVLPVLSPSAKEYFDRMDVDAEYRRFQIPIIHHDSFDELVQKGWLVPFDKQVVAADQETTGTTKVYVFNEAIRQQLDDRMYR